MQKPASYPQTNSIFSKAFPACLVSCPAGLRPKVEAEKYRLEHEGIIKKEKFPEWT